MSIAEKLKRIFLGFEDLIFTNHSCICCGREIPDTVRFGLCDKCYAGLEALEEPLCARCGEPLSRGTLKCDLCDNVKFAFDSNISCFYYNGTAKSVIKAFKYSGRQYYAEPLAELMSEKLAGLKDVDVVTFVPMSTKRRRERGYNQAELLAERIAERLGVPVIGLLSKDNVKVNQAKLSGAERAKSLSGTIHAMAEMSEAVKGKNILIVDDVFTTGSTLNFSAEEIRKLKPKSIRTLTFAKTKFNSLN